ncbi:RpiB/LacA/LacB family sugar-phosphate isomerase [bacterium]|nr:RpiB/LacA/LacB family sugar-phosphate isomerase [bacterium]
MIYLGADHRGFELKEQIEKYLDSIDIETTDLGAHELSPEDDYNEYAAEVAKFVRLERGNLGIVFCGSGNGVNIVANKYAEIRCAIAMNKQMAEEARSHNGANVLSIPADFIDFDTAKELITTFIKTPFSMEERHTRRVSKIVRLEENGLA